MTKDSTNGDTQDSSSKDSPISETVPSITPTVVAPLSDPFLSALRTALKEAENQLETTNLEIVALERRLVELKAFSRLTETTASTMRTTISELESRTKRASAMTRQAVDRLPAGVLEEIFYLHQQNSDPPASAIDSITITHVCRKWRSVALNYPQLWRSIPIWSKGINANKLSGIFAERAEFKDIELQTLLCTRCRQNPETLVAVLNNGIKAILDDWKLPYTAIKVLDIHYDGDYLQFDGWNLCLPQVKEVRIWHCGLLPTGTISPTLFEHFPEISELRLTSTVIPHMDSVIWHPSKILVYSYAASPENLLNLLAMAPNLWLVVLQGVPGCSSFLPEMQRTSYPNITQIELNLNEVHGGPYAFAELVSFPNLNCLGIGGIPFYRTDEEHLSRARTFLTSLVAGAGSGLTNLLIDLRFTPAMGRLMPYGHIEEQFDLLSCLRHVNRIQVLGHRIDFDIVLNQLQRLLTQSSSFTKVETLKFIDNWSLKIEDVISLVKKRKELVDGGADVTPFKFVEFQDCESLTVEEQKQLKELTA